MNEPNIFTVGGYDAGIVPPKRCSPSCNDCSRGNSSTEPYLAVHHILLAHASVARLYKKNYQVVSKTLTSSASAFHLNYDLVNHLFLLVIYIKFNKNLASTSNSYKSCLCN